MSHTVPRMVPRATWMILHVQTWPPQFWPPKQDIWSSKKCRINFISLCIGLCMDEKVRKSYHHAQSKLGPFSISMVCASLFKATAVNHPFSDIKYVWKSRWMPRGLLTHSSKGFKFILTIFSCLLCWASLLFTVGFRFSQALFLLASLLCVVLSCNLLMLTYCASTLLQKLYFPLYAFPCWKWVELEIQYGYYVYLILKKNNGTDIHQLLVSNVAFCNSSSGRNITLFQSGRIAIEKSIQRVDNGCQNNVDTLMNNGSSQHAGWIHLLNPREASFSLYCAALVPFLHE